MVVLTHDRSRLLLQRLEAQDLDICLAFGDIPGQFTKQPVGGVHLPTLGRLLSERI